MRVRVVVPLLLSALVAVAEAPEQLQPLHFSHATHRKTKLVMDSCTSCHATGSGGAVMRPGGKGHMPCLRSGCHASDQPTAAGPPSFFGIAARYRGTKIGENAQRFCLGCHATVPTPWQGTPLRVEPNWKNQREYHVELDHLAHTAKPAQSGCLGCHVVDAKQGVLAPGTPGHAQCITCHDGEQTFPMRECARCHHDKARSVWLSEIARTYGDRVRGGGISRLRSDVKACDSSGNVRFGDGKPCFPHEKTEHRVANGTSIPCKQCHFMIEDTKRWGGHRYQRIADLHFYKIVGDPANLASCGKQHAGCTTGCHAHDKDVRLGGNCTACHKTTDPRGICRF